MTSPKMPLVLRIAAVLLLAAVMFGQWWQRQPVKNTGGAFLATLAAACPSAVRQAKGATVAGAARALDRTGFALLANLASRDGRDRCRIKRPRYARPIAAQAQP